MVDEKVVQLLFQDPKLTPEQVKELSGVTIASIMSPQALVELGWRTAQRHMRTELGIEAKVK